MSMSLQALLECGPSRWRMAFHGVPVWWSLMTPLQRRAVMEYIDMSALTAWDGRKETPMGVIARHMTTNTSAWKAFQHVGFVRHPAYVEFEVCRSPFTGGLTVDIDTPLHCGADPNTDTPVAFHDHSGSPSGMLGFTEDALVAIQAFRPLTPTTECVVGGWTDFFVASTVNWPLTMELAKQLGEEDHEVFVGVAMQLMSLASEL